MEGVHWDASLQCICVDGQVPARRDIYGQYVFEFPLNVVADASLSTVRRALVDALGALVGHDKHIELVVSYGALIFPYPHTSSYSVDAYSVSAIDGPLRIELECNLAPDTPWGSAAKMATDVATSLNLNLIKSVKRFGEGLSDTLCAIVEAHHGLTIGEVSRMAQTMRRALLGVDAASDDPVALSFEVARSHGDVLLGLPESAIFDAKSAPYMLSSPAAKLEFALDVAAFSNSSRGGLIVLGARTKRDDAGRDVVVEVAGFDTSRRVNTSQYRDALARLVYPPLESVELTYVASGVARNNHLLMILVPPQRARRRPFLVKKEAADICIPVRRGDRKEYVTAEELYGWVAGAWEY